MRAPALVAHPTDRRRPITTEWLDLLGLCVMGGALVGVLVAGPALRLGMLLLRVTSPDSVIGRQSDDDFTIGQVTFAGTYNLFLLGVATGLLSCLAWVVVEAWLIGPRWFRLFTVAVTAALFVGPMLIHDDGIDFHALRPLWLAVTVFLVIPAVVALAAPVVLARLDRHRLPGAWRWVVPVLCLVPFPQASFVAALVCLPLFLVVAFRRTVLPRVEGSPVGVRVVRAVFLLVPISGAIALARDLSALAG